jgi:hypothetical protein
MPHLLIEIARGVLERQMLSIPIELDPSGAPADILAPPASIQDSLFKPSGTVRFQLIIRTVALQPIAGSAQAIVAMTFDESSIEALSLGKSVGLLGGHMSASASIVVHQGLAPDGRANATIGVDLSASIVTLQFDPASHGRLAAVVGGAEVTSIEKALAATLATRFHLAGFQSAGLTLGLTPGIPSEDVLTVEALPSIVWVDAQTLALALRYAAEPSPAPFQPVPFLPGGPTAFGMRLSNDGFQRTVRNPAVRKLARDMLTERRIDDFVHDAFVARGGVEKITDADRADGATRLDAYLKTPGGQVELANETPAPVGGGMLRKRVRDVPDPFSDFDVEVPELDLWLGEGRVEGRAVARGAVNGFGFTAHIRFRATPVLVQGADLSIELHDLEIDRPDIDIDLPIWLKWATAVLVGVIAGPLTGALVGFLLSAVVSALAEAFIPSNLGSKVDPPKGKSLGKLPSGVLIQRLDVTPEFLAFSGSWSVSIDDPRPFYPRATIVDTVDRKPSGRPSKGSAAFVCLTIFGSVISAREGTGTRFAFVRQAWTSTARVTLQTSAIPLPLTRFPWKIAVGYRTKEQYPAMPDPPMILVPGAMPVTATVWHPEPPFLGRTERRSFTLDVSAVGDDGFAIGVPADAGCITIELSTRVIDALGTSWEDLHYVDVPNETVSFGADFQEFAAKCGKSRREIHIGSVPSLLDELWNPPNILVERVREAIRTEQPAMSREIGKAFASHGHEGLQVLLAPSLAGKVLKGHGG